MGTHNTNLISASLFVDNEIDADRHIVDIRQVFKQNKSVSDLIYITIWVLPIFFSLSIFNQDQKLLY